MVGTDRSKALAMRAHAPLFLWALSLMAGFPFTTADAAAQAAVPPSKADVQFRDLMPGLDSSQVRALLANPDSTTVERSLYDESRMEAEWYYDGFSVAFDTRGRLLGVTLLTPGVATPRGLRVGDKAARMLELYAEPTRRDGDRWRYEAADDRRFVMQVQMRDERIVWIYLGRQIDLTEHP